MKFLRLILVVSLLCLAGLFAFACGDDDEDDGADGTPSDGTPSDGGDLQTDFGVTDTEITLGMTLAQSGNPSASAYAVIASAIEATFAKYNAEDNGACNRQINFIVEDDQYDPAQALERATKLAEQDEVVAFVGNLGTPAVSGQVDYINDPNGDGDTSDGVPHLYLSTGASKWNDPEQWPWTIGYIPDYVLEGNILAQAVNEQYPDSTAAILYQNDDFGEDGRQGFTELYEGEIVAEQSYEAGATEITSQLANIRDADPDIVFAYSLPLTTASVFRYMQANNWNPQVVWSYVNPSSLLGAVLGGEEGEAAGYAQIAGVISTNYILDPISDTDNPAITEHLRVMSEYGGPDPNQLAVYGHTLADLVVETLNVACENGDMTRAGVLAAAESLQGFRSDLLLEGITVNLSSDDHAALEALQPVTVAEDGSLEPLGELVDFENEDGGEGEDSGAGEGEEGQ